jgi:hypothetical protein
LFRIKKPWVLRLPTVSMNHKIFINPRADLSFHSSNSSRFGRGYVQAFSLSEYPSGSSNMYVQILQIILLVKDFFKHHDLHLEE